MELWSYSGEYWEQREKKLQLVRAGLDGGELLHPSAVTGQACDFTSYEPKPKSTSNTGSTENLTDTDSDIEVAQNDPEVLPVNPV